MNKIKLPAILNNTRLFKKFRSTTRKQRLIALFIAIAVILPTIIFTLLNTKDTQAAWSALHREWKTRQRTPITNNSGATLSENTTVAITIDTKELVETGKLNTNCSDLRVLYQPNNTTSTELPRHLSYPAGETCATSQTTKVSFSLQASLSNNATTSHYYLYYANPQATTPTDDLTAYNIGEKQALLICPFNGTTECINGNGAENPTTETGAIRYSGEKSAISFNRNTRTSSNITYSGTGIDNLLESDATVEFWMNFKPETVDGTNFVPIAKRGSAPGTGWWITVPDNNAVYVNVGCSTTSAQRSTSANAVTRNEWTHIALTWNAATKTPGIFINGVSQSLTGNNCVGNYNGDAGNTFYVGRDNESGQHFRGDIDELRVSNTIRYTENFTPQTTPFIRDSLTRLLYHFDENGDDPRNTGKVIDNSGYNLHGTINNAHYVSGVVGINPKTSSTQPGAGKVTAQTYAANNGIFIEEGTTNKITNPSFEHSTFDNGWTDSGPLEISKNTSSIYTAFGDNSVKAVNTPLTSHHLWNWNASVLLYTATSTKQIAQGFQVPSNSSIYSADILGYRTGSDVGQYFRVEIQTDNSGEPSGTVVSNGASACKPFADFFTGYSYYNTFSFPTPPSLTSSTQYHLVLRVFTNSDCSTEQSSTNSSSYIRWGYRNSGNSYTLGDRAVADDTGTWTTHSNQDHIFALYDTDEEPVFITTINPGNTNTHTLSAYVYVGRTETSLFDGYANLHVAQLVWEGVAQTTTSYQHIGGGWWRLSYSAATTNASNEYGIKIMTDRTLYIDGVQLEEKAYATTYTDGSLGDDYSWSGTAHESMSIREASDLNYTSSGNFPTTEGAISIWIKSPHPSSILPAGQHRIIHNEGGSNGYALNYNKFTNTFEFVKRVSGTIYTASVSSSFSANTWVHLVATYDTVSGTALHVNAGTPGTNTNTEAPSSVTSQTDIGGRGSGGVFVVSDTRTFNSALSASEVADLYYSGLVSRSQSYEVDRFGHENEGPVAIWKFDESSGTTAHDASPFGNHLTVSGTTWNTQSVGANNQRVRNLSFNGVDSFASRTANTSSQLNFGTNAFSLSGFIRAPSKTIASNQFILAKHQEAGYGVYLNTSGQLCFGIDDDATWNPDDSACTTDPINDSSWHHFTAVKTTSAIHLYLNGTKVAEDTTLSATATLNNSSPFYLGAFSSTSGFFEGWLDDIVIYNYARSEDEIKTDLAGNRSAAVLGTQTNDPLTQGLVGYWKMDEALWNGTAGEVIDSSGNGNNGTGNGGVTTGAGKFGKGGDFDGSDDYVEIADSAELRPGDNSWTVAVWAKPENASQNRPIVAKRQNAGTFDQFNLIVCGNLQCGSSGRRLSVLYRGDNNYRYSLSDIDVADGNWHHFVMVADKSADIVRLYMDGVELSITTSSSGPWPVLNNTDPLQIGGENGSKFFNGQIDETRIYNRALTPAEVQSLYKWAPGPVAHWKFDEGTGTTARDSSGNENHGTIVNSGWGQGRYGSGLTTKIDDVQDVVTITHPSSGILDFEATQDFTISIWVKTTLVESGAFIFRKGHTGAPTTPGYAIGVNHAGGAGTSDCHYTGDNQQFDWFSGPSVYDGKWHHIACVMDRNGTATGIPGYHLFFDGVLRASKTNLVAGSSVSSSDITIGERTTSTELNAALNDARIYNYARTPEQIIQDMNAGHPAPGSPVGSASVHYKFDEGYGTTANNSGSGGSGLNGTIANGTWTNEGKFGRALTFASNTSVSRTITDPGNTHTLSVWVYPTTSAASKTLVTASRLTTDSSSRPVFGGCTGTALPLDTWTHIVAVSDGASSCTIYQNGTQTSTGTTGVTFGTSLNLGASSFTGRMDEFKLYYLAMSENQVATEYNQGQSTILGSVSTDSTNHPSHSATAAYCPPGQSTPCVGPVGHWKFDEKFGTSAYDTTGNSNNLTISSLLRHSWSTGKSGGALHFNDVNSTNTHVSATSNSYLNVDENENFTIQGWIKTDNHRSGEIIRWVIMKKQSIEVQYPGYVLYMHNSGTFRVRVADGTNHHLLTSPEIDDNRWHHFAYVFNRSNPSLLYIDGKVADSNSSTPTDSLFNAYDFYLGGYGTGGGNPYIGSLDEIVMYKYVRSPAQIAWDFNRGAPAGYWKFDECTGTTVNDWAPGAERNSYLGNNATITIGSGGTQTSAGNCTTTGTAWGNGSSGKFNASLNLDGTDDRAVTGTFSPFASAGRTTTNLSWGGWFNPAEFVSTRTLLEKTNEVRLNLNTSGKPVCDIYTGGTFTSNSAAASAPALTQNTWSHIMCVYDGSNIRLFVDGKLADSWSQTGTITAATSALHMGQNSSSAQRYQGKIDDVQIYNYALTPHQIGVAANHGAVRFGP
jgi:hypothetical protein